jgi:hypothetical protein
MKFGTLIPYLLFSIFANGESPDTLFKLSIDKSKEYITFASSGDTTVICKADIYKGNLVSPNCEIYFVNHTRDLVSKKITLSGLKEKVDEVFITEKKIILLANHINKSKRVSKLYIFDWTFKYFDSVMFDCYILRACVAKNMIFSISTSNEDSITFRTPPATQRSLFINQFDLDKFIESQHKVGITFIPEKYCSGLLYSQGEIQFIEAIPNIFNQKNSQSTSTFIIKINVENLSYHKLRVPDKNLVKPLVEGKLLKIGKDYIFKENNKTAKNSYNTCLLLFDETLKTIHRCKPEFNEQFHLVFSQDNPKELFFYSVKANHPTLYKYDMLNDKTMILYKNEEIIPISIKNDKLIFFSYLYKYSPQDIIALCSSKL